MTRAMNALYIADSIGQLAVNGVEIANQWNLANGTTGSGTDYGMISMDDGSTFPQYEAMAMWSRAGSELLPTAVEDDVVGKYGVRVIGRTSDISESYYAISAERRIKHPAVSVITDSARSELFTTD